MFVGVFVGVFVVVSGGVLVGVTTHATFTNVNTWDDIEVFVSFVKIVATLETS
jgi:hypothetical protein